MRVAKTVNSKLSQEIPEAQDKITRHQKNNKREFNSVKAKLIWKLPHTQKALAKYVREQFNLKTVNSKQILLTSKTSERKLKTANNWSFGEVQSLLEMSES